MKKKKWPAIIPILLLVLIFTYFDCTGRKRYNEFYRNKLNEIIVERDNWQLRATEFHLNDGVVIDSSYLQEFDLKVGDSIIKEKNTTLFFVYRKFGNSFRKIHEYKYIR